MGTIRVLAEGIVDAPADTVYNYLSDMRAHHPNFLPPAFSDFRVESGGVGAGTITRFTVQAGGRSREYRMQIGQPAPGVLTETDTTSSLVTTFTVTAQDGISRVQIETTWIGAAGIGGFFERTFAPRAMRAIYTDQLQRLNNYAREQQATGAASP